MTAQAPLALVIGLEPNVNPSVQITCLVAETLGATLTLMLQSRKGKKKWQILV